MSDVSARPAGSGFDVSPDGVTELRPPANEAMRRFVADLPGDDVAPAGRGLVPPPLLAAARLATAVQLLVVDAACAAVIAVAQRVRAAVAPG